MKSKLETTVVALVASMAIAGCGNNAKEQSTDDVVAIDLNNSDSVIDYRDVIAVDGWTQLSDVDEGIVSGVVKMAVDNNSFYLLDRRKERVLVFDKKGDFVNAVGNKGMGPGEYPAGRDFTVNRDDKEIVVLTGNSEVYVYDFDGGFKGKHKLADAEITGIEYSDGRYVATTSYLAYPAGGSGSCLLYQFDTEFNCTAKWMPYDKVLQSAFNPMAVGLSRIGSEVYYVDNIHMQLIQVAEQPDVRIKYVFGNPMPEDGFNDMMFFMQKQMEYDWLMNVIITKDKILAGYVAGGAYNVSVNKWSGENILNGQYRGYTIEGVAGQDGHIYTVVYPDDYLDSWKTRDVVHPAQDPTEDSNPLILKWHIAG